MPETPLHQRVSGDGVEHLVNRRSPHLSPPKNFIFSRTAAYIIAMYFKIPVVQDIYLIMMKKIAILGSGALFLSLSFVMGSASAAKAEATCFCKISKDDMTDQSSASGVLLDLTATVNKKYTSSIKNGLEQSDKNQADCTGRCNTAATPYTGQQSLATQACSLGATNGTAIRAYGAVGTRKYKATQTIGTLVNIAAVTQQICPAGSVGGTTNQPGVTTDGKCKKHINASCPLNPSPPLWTALGTWGFTGDNGSVYQWIQPTTNVVSAAQCKF
jgi:hypothetical protein